MTEPTLDRRLVLGGAVVLGAALATTAAAQPADHTMTLAGSTPILVLDMYEHAYAIDYGAKAAAYVDAFMAATNWTAADARFVKATA